MGNSLWERFRIWLSQMIYWNIWEEYYKKCNAIYKVLCDESVGDGWGPDVTTVEYLREAVADD